MSKIRKGDNVVVLSGRDKGRQGQVLKVLASGHVLVENVNKQKKHQKPNQQANQPGGIIEKEAPLHISNVQPVCSRCDKPARVGTRRLDDGSGVRICRRCGVRKRG